MNRETVTVVSEIAAGELKKKVVYEEAWRMSITHGLYRGEEDRQVCTCHHEELLWDAAITNEQVQEQATLDLFSCGLRRAPPGFPGCFIPLENGPQRYSGRSIWKARKFTHWGSQACGMVLAAPNPLPSQPQAPTAPSVQLVGSAVADNAGEFACICAFYLVFSNNNLW